MNNIDTVLSTFLTGYLKCNKKTHLLVSRQVKLFLLLLLLLLLLFISGDLPYNISYREGSDTQTDAFKFF